MTATLVDGKAIAWQIQDGIHTQIQALNVPLQLAVVCPGGDIALTSFVRLKQKAAQLAGIQFSTYFVEEAAQTEKTLRFLAADPAVNGILLELPIPEAWNSSALLALIPPEKDVDALAPENEAAYERDEAFILPPSVIALRHAMESYNIVSSGSRAVVIGAGRLVGRPIAHWLGVQGANVNVIDVDTPEPQRICAAADIVISGAGVPGLVTPEWIKEGAAVFDYGFHDGKGDVAASVAQKAGLLSPVPGGMGPIVVVAVMENLLTLVMR